LQDIAIRKSKNDKCVKREGDKMETCIFCQITAKKSEAYIIYENNWVCCFLDKFPINKGHVLVVPKKHYQEFSEVDEKSLIEVILAAQKAAKAIETLLKTDGITIMQNNGIFKDVEHYHMHIIPRYKDDGFSWVEPEITVNQDEFVDLKTSLQDYLKHKIYFTSR
jgi:histidine triad (HIT) family protein